MELTECKVADGGAGGQSADSKGGGYVILILRGRAKGVIELDKLELGLHDIASAIALHEAHPYRALSSSTIMK